MNTAADATANPWLITLRHNPQARLRLFCLPFAGGGANVFRQWPNALPPEVELDAFQLPGRERRILEAPCADLDALVTQLFAAMRSRLDLPFAIFGHSMGSILAFELARRLRREGELQPVHMFVSGRHAPQLPDPEPPIHHLPDAEFIKGVRRLNGLPDEVLDSADLMELVMPSLRADFKLCETYQYSTESPLGCGLSACGGLTDPLIDRPQLEAWKEQTLGVFAVRMFPGDHFYIDTARDQLLGMLCQDLDALLQGKPPC